MSLTRDQILAASDRKTVEVQTPEWGAGASIFVRMLTGAERDELEGTNADAFKAGSFKKNVRARYCAAFASDEEGVALFSVTDLDALAAKSGAVLTRIVTAGMKLNAMREKDIEELEKN